MTALLANKVVRRRAVAYGALLVISLVLMSVSANPLVRDLQHGVAFAFRPIQVAIDGVANEVSSIATTIAEIDRLRQENAVAPRRERPARRGEPERGWSCAVRTRLLTALLQLRNGLKYTTRAVTVIARESSEARPLARRSTEARTTASPSARSSSAPGGSLVGRVVEVGPTIAHVVLISDSTSTVTGPAAEQRGHGQGRRASSGGALVMTDVDSAAEVTQGEEVFTAGIELGGGIRSPYPKGLLIGRVIDVTTTRTRSSRPCSSSPRRRSTASSSCS